jgi:hypothetical protein
MKALILLNEKNSEYGSLDFNYNPILVGICQIIAVKELNMVSGKVSYPVTKITLNNNVSFFVKETLAEIQKLVEEV